MKRGVVSAGVAMAAFTGLHALGLTPWSEQARVSTIDLAVVLAAAAAAACADVDDDDADRSAVRVSFLAETFALLLIGRAAMTIIAVVGILPRLTVKSLRTPVQRELGLDLLRAVGATQAAGVAYAAAAALPVSDVWIARAVQLLATVVAYCIAGTAVTDVIAQGSDGTTRPAWPRQALRHIGGYAIVAAIGAAALELIAHHAWSALAVCALPSGFALQALRTARRTASRRSLPAIAAIDTDHGVCVIDREGILVDCNAVAASALNLPLESVGGRRIEQLATALPPSVVEAVRAALTTRAPRVLRRIPLRSAGRAAVFDVAVAPAAEGATVVWSDVTAEHAAERQLKEAADRFTLIARAANDGLWELEPASGALFVSARWREIVGLAEDAPLSKGEWLERVHPDDRPGLNQALETLATGAVDRADHEHRLRHEDGSYRRVVCRSVAARDARRQIARLAGSLTDVTESAIAREKIINAGSRDLLTGLLNRSAFIEKVGHRLDDYKARRGGRFATLFLDLDRFKVVNDSLGHRVGDELLAAVARRLESCLRPGDAVARFGGDEYAVLLQNITDEIQANVVAFRLQEALQAPFPIGGRDLVTSASIGIAICRGEHTHAEELMRDADTAMCHAKSHGKARHELFDADTHARAADRLGLENDLRAAVKNRAFEVHYQPIVSLTSRMTTGFESLVRWNRHGTPVSPADFIPVAEELGIIEPLGTFVMQQACRQFVEWKARFPQTPLDCITVNVSAKQLVQQGFVYLVEQTVERNGMNPADLRLEITETALMDAPQFVARVLAELREFGVKVYLDDFGTGYSSLSHLHKLPVDALKIDRSFVRGLLIEERPAIVESILALARTLQTSVVAEGIEDERQAAVLERLGCQRAQGFYFSRPVPAAEVEQLLALGRPLGAPRVPPPQPARASLLKPVPSRGIA